MKILSTAIGILLVVGFTKLYFRFRRKITPDKTEDRLWNMPLKKQIKMLLTMFLIFFIPAVIFLLCMYFTFS